MKVLFIGGTGISAPQSAGSASSVGSIFISLRAENERLIFGRQNDSRRYYQPSRAGQPALDTVVTGSPLRKMTSIAIMSYSKEDRSIYFYQLSLRLSKTLVVSCRN